MKRKSRSALTTPTSSTRKKRSDTLTIPLPRITNTPREAEANMTQTVKVLPQTPNRSPRIISNRPKTAIVRPIEGFLKTSRKFEFQKSTRETPRARKLDTCVETQEMIENFIRDYIRDKSAQECAKKIQDQWHCYRDKTKWSKFIKNRINNRRGSMLKMLIGWHGAASKKINTITECYQRFGRLMKKNPHLISKGNIAPFGIFYLQGKWFIPKSVTQRDYYKMVRLFSHTDGRFVLGVWHRVATSIRSMREASRSFRFTLQKRLNFGFSFYAFILWHRFTKWKKESKVRRDCFQLSCTEFIIDWRVKEQDLNLKKARLARATTYSLTRITKKSVSALYQLYIDRKQEMVDMESSIAFYLRHVHERGERAWMKYIENQRKKSNEAIRIMRTWYAIAFEKAQRKAYINILRKHQVRLVTSRIFKSWNSIARIGRLRFFKSAFKIQKRPLFPYMVIFKWIGQYDLYLFIQMWREWILVAKRRRMWRAFLIKSKEFDEEKEFKQKVYYSLKRASKFSMITRFVHPCQRYFPLRTFISYEGTLKAIKENEINVIPKVDWKFITQLKKNNDIKSMNGLLLVRLLIMAINNLVPCDFADFYVSPLPDPPAEPFNHILTYDELKNQYVSNVTQLKKQNLARMQRDNATLSIITSHISAMNYHVINRLFSIVIDDKDICTMKLLDRFIPKLAFRTEEEESIEYHVNNLLKLVEQRTLPPEFKQDLYFALQEFHEKVRYPKKVVETAVTTALNSPREMAKQPQQSGSTRTRVTAISVSPFKSPIWTEKIPFTKPELKILRFIQEKFDNQQQNGGIPEQYNVRFNTSHIVDMLSAVGTLNMMLKAISRFFFHMCDLRIEFRSPIEYRGHHNLLDSLDVDLRHKCRRNSASFVAQLANKKITTAVPLDIDAPVYAYDCASAVLSLFNELKKSSVMLYCDSIPFPEFVDINSPFTLQLRSSIVYKAYEKFPKLTKKGPQKKNFRVSIGSEDILTNQDVLITAFLLPHCIRPELVKEFIKTEIKIEQTLKNTYSTSSINLIEIPQSITRPAEPIPE